MIGQLCLAENHICSIKGVSRSSERNWWVQRPFLFTIYHLLWEITSFHWDTGYSIYITADLTKVNVNKQIPDVIWVGFRLAQTMWTAWWQKASSRQLIVTLSEKPFIKHFISKPSYTWKDFLKDMFEDWGVSLTSHPKGSLKKTHSNLLIRFAVHTVSYLLWDLTIAFRVVFYGLLQYFQHIFNNI